MKKRSISIVALIVTLGAVSFVVMQQLAQTEEAAYEQAMEEPEPAAAVLASGGNYELTAERLLMRAPLTEKDTVVHDVHAHTPDGPHSAWSYHYLKAPADMWVTSISVSVENAPLEIIHHLALGRQGQPSVICGETINQMFNEYYTVSRSNIHEPIVFQSPYGLFIAAGEPLILEVMTHILQPPFGPGLTTTDPITVQLEFALATADDIRDKPVQYVRLRLDDTPCEDPVAHQAFAVPAQTEQFVRQSNDLSADSSDHYTFPASGVLLARSANLWGSKGGESLTVFINGVEQETFRTYQDAQPWEWRIDAKYEPLVVSAGDVLTIESVYTNMHDTPIKDASGMFGFYYSQE